MKILIGCEYSGKVRQAFRNKGHDAWSCDIIPSDDNSPYHIQDDIMNHLDDGWDMMICFPPCTHLCVSGARWFKDKIIEQKEALNFVKTLLDSDIPKIVLENPVGIISTRIRKPEQIIQPYEFGHTETKRTCLWLKGLKKLTPTDNVYDKMMELPKKIRNRIHYMPKSKTRGKDRSETFIGIANAMADQWG